MSLPKPPLPLLAIAATVALAHVALLRGLPTLLHVAPPATVVVQALSTRSIPAPPPVVAPTPVPAAAPPPVRPVAPPQPEAPTPVAQAHIPPEPAAEPAPPPLPEPAASAPVPDPLPDPAPPTPPAEPAAAPAPAAPAPAVPLTHATVFAFPDPVRLLYALTGEAKKLAYNARGELLWQQDGQRYEATLRASMLFLGSRTRTSSGSITPEGLAPQRFADKWRTEQAAHFDQARQRASFSANTPDVALQTAAQDQLSVILQIAGILAAAPAQYPPGASLAIQTIGPKDADTWVFTVEARETIHLPSGTLDAQKLTRNPRKPYDQKVELWLAPAMGYLPVRLKITNANGDYIDQQLRGVEKP